MLRYDAVLAVSGHHEPMRERKGAGRNDLGIAGRFILAAIVSALVWRHSLLEIVPFLVGATLGFWLIVRARKRSSDRRQ